VIYCEEFDCFDPTLKERRDKSTSRLTDEKTVFVVEEEEVGKFEGLCMNCDNRRFCVYQAIDNKTLYCEEYL